MAKGNPRPKQSETFKQKRFQRLDVSDERLAEKVRGIRLSESVDRLVECAFTTKEARAAWLRGAIREAALQTLLPQQQHKASELLQQGVDIAQVVEQTGLSRQEIEALSAPSASME